MYVYVMKCVSGKCGVGDLPTQSKFNDNVNINRFAVLSVGLNQVSNNNYPLHFDWLDDTSSELTMSMQSF